MPATAKKTAPALWDKVKRKVTKGDKGGKPGQWSARKAQLAVHDYKEEGGSYSGAKTSDNHLSQWTKEDWGTKSGHESGETGERYLPRKVRASLTDEEYRQTTRRKRADSKAGKQFSAQPKAIARKASATRHQMDSSVTRVALLDQARKQGIPGVSRMRKAEIQAALAKTGKAS